MVKYIYQKRSLRTPFLKPKELSINPFWKIATNRGLSMSSLYQKGIESLSRMSQGATKNDSLSITGLSNLNTKDLDLVFNEVALRSRACKCYGNYHEWWYNPFSWCFWNVDIHMNVTHHVTGCGTFTYSSAVIDYLVIERSSLDPFYLDFVSDNEDLELGLINYYKNNLES